MTAVALAGPVAAATPSTSGDIGGGDVTIAVPGGHYADFSAGGAHSLAVGVDQAVYAWGASSRGRLALPDDFVGPTDRPNESATPHGKRFTAVSAGSNFSVALAEDGHVWAWGYGSNGQLGDGVIGLSGQANTSYSPVRVKNLAGVKAIDAANTDYPFVLALTTSGKVYAWGSNKTGQLGNGDYDSSGNTAHPNAKRVTGLPTITAIAANNGSGSDFDPFALALDGNGDVWAWGSEERNQLGGPTPDSTKPAKTVTGKNFVDISAGGRFAMGLTASGDVWTWGNQTQGRLGNGSSSDSSSGAAPARVTGLPTITAISAGPDFAIALDSNGRAWSWGSNADGQLGHPSTGTGHGRFETTPVKVTMPAGVSFTDVDTGSGYVLAKGNNGKLYGWGANDSGQLGTGSTTSKAKPAPAATGSLPPSGEVDVTDVTFDGKKADRSTIESHPDGTFTVRAPSHQAGTVDVVIYWRAGGVDQAPIYLPGGFRYDCAPFPDVDSSNPHCTNISWLKGKSITMPADGKYHPANPVNRGSMTAFLFRLTHPGQPSPKCSNTAFPDVDSSNIFCGYITWAANNGVAMGYPDGTFRSNNGVTRGAMAAFLKRIATHDRTPTCHRKPFADVSTTETFCGVITWMKTEKLTFGVGDGTNYGTNLIVSRQSMASFLHRIHDYMR